LQNRFDHHLGKAEKGFVHENVADGRIFRRHKAFKELDRIRVDYCGAITPDYLKTRNSGVESLIHDSKSRWRQISKSHSQMLVRYAKNATLNAQLNIRKYKLRSPNEEMHSIGKSVTSAKNAGTSNTYDNLREDMYMTYRSTCSGQHPRLANVHVSIERIGPFTSHGGHSTIVGHVDDFAGLSGQIRDKTVYVVGKFWSPVNADGSIVGYPPIHIHHAHVYPYDYDEMQTKIGNQYVRDMFHHHVLVQSHGDSECKFEEGGTSCLLEQLPDDQGYRIVKSRGLNGDFELNDVRPVNSPELNFFVDIAILWTTRKKIETTFLQMGAPIIGNAWMTYHFPLDPHTNFIYYNFTNKMLGSGELSNYILHTHMSLLDSVYIFKGPLVYSAIENFRKKRKKKIPYIFECHGENITDAKKEILSLAAGSLNAELICEATKPSVQLQCSDSLNIGCAYIDKRVDFNCRSPARFEANETLVVLAFNRVRNTSTVPLTRHSSPQRLAVMSPWGYGYSGEQHTILRADFVSDKARQGKMGPSAGDGEKDLSSGNYAPPSLFLYKPWPTAADDMMTLNPHLNLREEMLRNCELDISFKADSLFWEKL